MNQSFDTYENALRLANPVIDLTHTADRAPNFAALASARRTRRIGRLAVALAAPVLAVFALSLRGGSDEVQFADSAPFKATAAPGAQGASAGSLELGISASETVVIDQSFRSLRDGFSFPNWGGEATDDKIDASTMAALFTKEAVCVDPSAGSCVMLPAAQKIADQMNAAIAAGRCEGFSVMTQRFFDGLDPRAEGVLETALISRGSVGKQIGYWWATQVAPPVSKESKRFRAMNPSQVVVELEKGIQQKLGYTMGLYSAEGGHSVTPIAVTTAGSIKTVYIYDNNYPKEIRKIQIDTATETWTYGGGGLNASNTGSSWSGAGAGSLDLTPMAVRKGPFKVSFGSTRGLKGQAYSVMVTQSEGSTANVGVRIRTRIAGKDVDVNTMDLAQVAAAPFAIKSLVGNFIGRGAIAYVPVVAGEVGMLTLDVVGDKSAGPITMSILRTGTSSIVVESASDFKVQLTTESFSTDAQISHHAGGTVGCHMGPRQNRPTRTPVGHEVQL